MHDPYLKWSQPSVSFCTVYEHPAVDAGLVHSCCDKQEVRCRCVFQLEPSLLRLSTLYSRSSLALPNLLFTYWGYLLSERGCSIFGKYLNALTYLHTCTQECMFELDFMRCNTTMHTCQFAFFFRLDVAWSIFWPKTGLRSDLRAHIFLGEYDPVPPNYTCTIWGQPPG